MGSMPWPLHPENMWHTPPPAHAAARDYSASWRLALPSLPSLTLPYAIGGMLLPPVR